eukprot:m.34140 g.34140  ORF g.34140 m.34140 type:complete len:216 (+) comp6500_c2_seq2:153-800(+)
MFGAGVLRRVLVLNGSRFVAGGAGNLRHGAALFSTCGNVAVAQERKHPLLRAVVSLDMRRYESTLSKLFGGRKTKESEASESVKEDAITQQVESADSEASSPTAFADMEMKSRPEDAFEFVFKTYDDLFASTDGNRPLPSMEEKFVLLAECEFAYGLSIPSSAINSFETAEDIATYLENAVVEEVTDVFGFALKQATEEGTLPPNIVITDKQITK